MPLGGPLITVGDLANKNTGYLDILSGHSVSDSCCHTVLLPPWARLSLSLLGLSETLIIPLLAGSQATARVREAGLKGCQGESSKGAREEA